MSKEIYISSTPHETRLAIVENDELTEIYYERENEYTLAGSIYNGKVTRVLPGMQSSFVDIGLERDAFLYITDFMEEAADTAEFDHSGDTPRPARVEAPRGEGQGDSGGRDRDGRDRDNGRNGNERSGAYVSERNQEQANATPGTDMARASEGRVGEFGGRNDRGGRGRGRGRRDRNGAGDRSGGTERSGNGEVTPRFGQTPVAPEEVEQKPIAMAEDSFASEANNVAELGEGAPGADESRRWRGRRGRRRGRGQQDVSATAPLEQVSQDEFSTVAGSDLGTDEPTSFEIDGSGPASIAHTITPIQPQEPIREASSGGQDRSRDRGGRGDRAGRGDRDQRPRVPRGFAPTRNLYGVDSAGEEEVPYGQPVESLSASGAELEPLILPGESLSKYRKGGEESSAIVPPASSFATQVTLPDTSFKVDPNWDGGAMLPGETLSRYRGGSYSSAAAPADSGTRESRRPEGRREERGGRQNDRSRGGRRDGRDSSGSSPSGAGSQHVREEVAEAPMLVPSTVPPPDLQSGGPVAGYAHVEEHSEEIQAHHADLGQTELPPAAMDAPTMEDKGLAHQEGEQGHGEIEQIDLMQEPAVQEDEPMPQTASEQEYEPEGESASYRVDLAGPSEYRQTSAPAADASVASDEVGGDSEPESGEAYEVSEVGFSEPETTFGSSADDLQGQERNGAGEGLFLDMDGGSEGSHEVTTIHATGEMESELLSSDQPLAGEVAAQGFAPGAGDLEEDFIEEDEVESVSLQARGEEEFDDLEEEQLEGAADLGTMIREMSLDQMTRTEGASTEEEDDFEEDTLEEDGEFAEEQPERASFAAPQDGQGEEEPSGFSTGVRSEVAEVLPSTAESERRARREAGRRGGRDRSGNRDGGGRSPRGERSSSDETREAGSSDRGGYSDRSGLGDRARNTGGSSERDRGRSSGRGGRQSMQMTNLPAISDLLKPGQEILCQIAKEPIAKKGARITSHIALPGRFLVFMPTVSHTGVSRKIDSDVERRRLKEILLSEKGEAAGGFIVRTAAEGASEDELRSDLRFLLNLWADIKRRSESSKSPALIYHDLNLVERILRDQVTDNFSAIWVDTETEYERVLRFLQRFQPGLIRRVKLYTKETPLFEQFGITEEINKALRSKVWLKSGGSIVINQTEALVAIDINTGKYVGKTARLEDTIVKTNLDAIPEIVRQIRLRDLGGIIIIDFIDMDERKNRNRVMAALEDELKTDRAPSKILPFNDFGLVAITRKRVKQSLERTLSTTCGVCAGTGMVKSPVTVCNDIYVEMRKMHKHLDRGDVMLRVNPEVVKQLKSTGTHWLQEMEEMCGKTILIKSDPSLHPEQFDIH